MNDIKDHVVKIGTARALKDADYPQTESIFVWALDANDNKKRVFSREQVDSDDRVECFDMIAAPMASEIEIGGYEVIQWQKEDDAGESLVLHGYDSHEVKFNNTNEAEARATAWLFMKEQKVKE